MFTAAYHQASDLPKTGPPIKEQGEWPAKKKIEPEVVICEYHRQLTEKVTSYEWISSGSAETVGMELMP